jgi:hypothetical protein
MGFSCSESHILMYFIIYKAKIWCCKYDLILWKRKLYFLVRARGYTIAKWHMRLFHNCELYQWLKISITNFNFYIDLPG